MILFKILPDVVEKKRGDVLQDVDEEKEFAPFMCQRYLSMFSGQFAEIVNNTSNVLWKVITDKQDWYKLFLCVIPKCRFRKIEYIKKEKKTTKKGVDVELIQMVADRMEISKREVISYIESEGITNTQMKKLVGE